MPTSMVISKKVILAFIAWQCLFLQPDGYSFQNKQTSMQLRRRVTWMMIRTHG